MNSLHQESFFVPLCGGTDRGLSILFYYLVSHSSFEVRWSVHTDNWFGAVRKPESKKNYIPSWWFCWLLSVSSVDVNGLSSPFLQDNSELSVILLFSGQIDGQEITASAVLTQRIRPPPRRLSPPRRMPPPPPMWRRSPPRMRRRYVD